jgi:hypothetical protein
MSSPVTYMSGVISWCTRDAELAERHLITEIRENVLLVKIELLHLLVHWRHRSTTTSFQALLSTAVFSRSFQVFLVLLISDSISRLHVFRGRLSFVYLEGSRTKPVWLCSHEVFSVYGLAISNFYISVLVQPVVVLLSPTERRKIEH